MMNTDKNMNLRVTITRLGNRPSFVAEINKLNLAGTLTLNQLQGWFNRDEVPLEYCPAIKVATNGVTSMHELRPDFFDKNDQVIMPKEMVIEVEPEIPKEEVA